MAAGTSWHPATDQLSGSESYGTECAETASCTFSKRFDTYSFTQFKFSTGDGTKWLIATKDAVTGGYYSNAQRPIIASSASSSPSQARWYRRAGNSEDPWVSINDHGAAIAQGNIVYGEAGFGSTHASAVLPLHNGANVYVDGACP